MFMEDIDDIMLTEMLRSLRLRIAREQQVSAFVVFTNSILDDLVKYRPQTLEKLKAYTDLGETRIQKYGEQIIDVIKNGYPIIDVPQKSKSEIKAVSELERLTIIANEQKLIVFPYLWDLTSGFLSEFDERTQAILKLYVEGNSLGEIANQYDLSSERVRQILHNGLVNLKRTSSPEYKQLQEENKKLRLQLDEYKCKLEVYMSNEKRKYLLDSANNAYLEDLDISVRLLNAVNKIGVKTLAQLCQLTESQFVHLPGIGKKSIIEAKELLKSRGLSFQLNSEEIKEVSVQTYNDPLQNQDFDFFNRGKAWSEEDVDIIEKRFEAGDDMVALITALGRTPNAIMAKLKSLGYDVAWEKIGDPTILPEYRKKL